MKTNMLMLTLIFLVMNQIDAQNPGDIVFSSTPINPLQPEGLKTTFNAGDNIYSIAYLPQTVKDFYKNSSPNAKLEVEIFIYELKPPLYSYQSPSEEQLTYASLWVSGTIVNEKYLLIDLLPDAAKTNAYGTEGITYKDFGKKYDGPVNFAETLAKLGAGEHELKVLVKCYYNDVASGTIKISGDDFSAYQKLSEQLNATASSASASNAVFPEQKLKDAAAETRMIAALKNSNDWKTGFAGGTEVIRISIVDSDWHIRRHEISGAILHRYIKAAIAFKTKTGGCAYRLFTFQEDYIGGKFQPLKYDGAGDLVNMDCGNIDK